MVNMVLVEKYQYNIFSQIMLHSIPIQTPASSPLYLWESTGLCQHSWARSHNCAVCWLSEETLTIQLSPLSCLLLRANMVPWLSPCCWQFDFNLVWTQATWMPAALNHWSMLSGSAQESQKACSKCFPGTRGTVTQELAPALHPHISVLGGSWWGVLLLWTWQLSWCCWWEVPGKKHRISQASVKHGLG